MYSRIRFAATAALGLGISLSPAGAVRAAEAGQVSETIISMMVEDHQINVTPDDSKGVWAQKLIGSAAGAPFGNGLWVGAFYGQKTGDGGSGSFDGSSTMTNASGSLNSTEKGTFTVIMADGKPSGSTNVGTWEWTGGAGRYAHVRGHGTFKSVLDPSGVIITNLVGTYTDGE